MSMIPGGIATMSTLPYGGMALNRGYRAYRRFKPYSARAMALGQYAFEHQKQLGHAAKTIRGFKRKIGNSLHKKKVTSKIGEDTGSGTSKRAKTVNESNGSKSTRSLYLNNVMDIERGSALNKRERDMIHVKGFKLCMEVKSNTATVSSGNELLFNYALLCPKSNGVETAKFFRHSDGDTRNQDFSTNLNSTEFHCLPINNDKYHVLMHRKLRLGDSLNDVNSSYRFIQQYIPINRQFRYEEGGAGKTVNYDQIFLVYWADIGMKTASSAVVTAAYNVTNSGILYFNDVCNC